MVVHAYDPSIWEAEAEERQGQDQYGLYYETLFQKTEWLVSDFRHRVEISISWFSRTLLSGPWSSALSLSSWC